MLQSALPLDVVILAGGLNQIQLHENYKPGYKALVEFNGRPSIQYTVDAVLGIAEVNRICIVAPPEVREACTALKQSDRFEYTKDGDSFISSVINGLTYFNSYSQVLVVTADIPLVDTEALRDFLTSCRSQETDYGNNAYLSVIPKYCFQQQYEKSQKAFNRFKDIAICHGNAMLVDPQILNNRKARQKINALYNSRKNPVQAALAVGIRLGMAYSIGVHLFHMLKLEQMARLASRRFHFGIIPVIVDHPCLAIDVDEAADYELVKDILAHN